MSRLTSSPPPADLGMRCIAHIDMDCFYAQVEGVRLGVDCRTEPFACVQWGSFIAVNYPARARGIKRFRGSPQDILQAFPDLKVGHIATYAMGELEYGYPETPRINTHKVSLEPYRRASREIFAILRSEPGTIVGKAGIDEAYVDVTEAARLELARVREAAAAAGHGDVPLDPLRDVMEPSTRLIADRREEMAAWFAAHGTSLSAVFDAPMQALLRGECGGGVEGSRGFCVDAADAAYGERCLLLCAASRVVHRLRQRICTELHYDCSAGIAHNRVLAKCISATHKPNQQTLLLPERSASALFELPLRNLRGFGGKFGAAVSAVCGGATECRAVWLAPLPQLYQLDGLSVSAGEDEEGEEDDEGGGGGGGHGFGEAEDRQKRRKDGTSKSCSVSEYTYYSIRGIGGDRVSDPALPRGMEASKIFHPMCTSWSAAKLWMAPLAGELLHRFRWYEDRYELENRSLVVYIRTYADPADPRKERHCSRSYRRHTLLPAEALQVAQIAEWGLREFVKLMRDVTQGDTKDLQGMLRKPSTPSTPPPGPPAPPMDGSSLVHTMRAEGQMAEAGRSNGAAPQTDDITDMPPLRIIGLSIIGLRLKRPAGEADGVGPSVADAPQQRSLKDMFYALSANNKAATGSASKDTQAANGNHSGVGDDAKARPQNHKRERSVSGSRAATSPTNYEVLDADDVNDVVDSDGDAHPASPAIGATMPTKPNHPSGTVDESFTQRRTGEHAAAPPTQRRTLVDFFHTSPVPVAPPTATITTSTTSGSRRDGAAAKPSPAVVVGDRFPSRHRPQATFTERRTAHVDEEGKAMQPSLPLRALYRSSSPIEVSDDDDVAK